MIIDQFNTAIDSYMALWYHYKHVQYGQRRSILKRTMCYLRIKKSINHLCKKLSADMPQNMAQMKDNKDILALIKLWLEFDVSQMSDTLKDDYIMASELFIKRVKARWPNISSEDIFQALRNVWIMIALQIMHEMPVELTDAMFAYSMLYPLTDNLLDDVHKTQQEKRLFNAQLSKRLRGLEVTPYDTQESDVFEMIALIEKQFSRKDYPKVYESLLLIHDAQISSLSQQYTQISDARLLKLSFEKGAASVIADGYLVFGDLNDQQFRFLTGYGIVLQLADDLQDLEDDQMAKHTTLFSSENSAEQLCLLTQRLIQLSKETLTFLPSKHPLLKEQMATLLDKSLSYLIYDAIFLHKKKMPRHFIKQINQCHLTGLTYYNRLKKISKKWMLHLNISQTFNIK